MTSSVLEAAAAGRAAVLRLTVEQFHGMVENGIVSEGDAIELIEGMLVQKDRQDHEGNVMVHGPRHKSAVAFLTRLLPRVESFGCWLQVQLPLAISQTSEPEPDAAIVIGRPDDYLDRHAAPEEVRVVFEVAAHSLAYDQGPKLALYAAAGIPVYVIIDLVSDRVDVYRDPRGATYAQRTSYGAGHAVTFDLGAGALSVSVEELVPRRV